MTTPRTTQGGGRPTFRRGGRRRRQCFCKESTVDYKDVSSIRRFITDRGRIEAGKKSGNCAKCQRTLTTAIKRARHLALLPYAPDHLRVTGAISTSSKISEEEKEVADEKVAETSDAPESSEVAAVSEDAPTTGEAESEAPAAEAGDAEESEADETEADADDVSTDESSKVADGAPESEESKADSSDEEDK